MNPQKKQARDFVKSIKTKAELDAYLNMLNLTDDEREIARLLFGRGWSRTQIAMELGYSEHQIKQKINRIYDRMI